MATVLLVILLLVLADLVFPRDRLYDSSVTDDVALWINERSRLYGAGRRSVVLIGASRIQVGVDLDTFALKTGIRPVQLAINGNSPLPVLENLAQDVDFSGTVICSITGAGPLRGMAGVTAREWVKAYENIGKTPVDREYYARLEESLRTVARQFVRPQRQLFALGRAIDALLVGGGAPEIGVQI